MDHHKHHAPKSNGPRTTTTGGSPTTAAASGGHKGKSKKPIKVVYISNPMRVKTSAAGFRALVQELTGRDADPSKYTDEAAAAAAATADERDRTVGPQLSPAGEDAEAGPAGQPDAASAFDGEFDDEDDSFKAQLLDNSYSVLSPPTLLQYDQHNKV